MVFSETDIHWMQLALEQANNSKAFNEVPVGAVIVRSETMIGKGGNSPISLSDPTAHAEIVAIRDAAQTIGNYRLPGSTLYVTLEPCVMCMGAIIHARIERLIFGAYDPKSGAAVSNYCIGSDGLLNHSLSTHGGLLEPQCSTLLTQFFRDRR